MKTVKSPKRIAAVTCFSALCLALSLGLSGCTDKGFGGFTIGYNGYIHVKNYAKASSYSIGDFTYGKSDITALEVAWPLGSVELKQSDGDSLTVTESSGALEDKYKMHWLVDNSTLYIKFWESGLSGKVRAEDKALTVEIPASLAKVQIDTASADITADEVNATHLEIDTASGSVTAGGLTASDLEIDTASGSVSVGSVSATQFELDTASGFVKIDSLTASKCSIATASGNININALSSTGGCELDTASGEISLGSANVSNLLNIHSASGSVTVNDLTSSTLDLDVASGNIMLGLRSLSSGSIDSASGEIVITRLDGFGVTVTFDSASGRINGNKDGTYAFGDGACRLEIDTASGDVTVD